MSSKQFPLPCTKSCSNVCFFFAVSRAPNCAPMRALFSRFAVHQMVLQCVLFSAVCRAPIVRQRVLFSTACRAPERAQCVLFSAVCRAPDRAPMRVFSRFAMHQIVLQCVLFSQVCLAPSRAPMRAFFSGLSCAKSCCMVPMMIIMLKVRALVTLFFRALKMKQKRGKTKNGRFRVVFLFGA